MRLYKVVWVYALRNSRVHGTTESKIKKIRQFLLSSRYFFHSMISTRRLFVVKTRPPLRKIHTLPAHSLAADTFTTYETVVQ